MAESSKMANFMRQDAEEIGPSRRGESGDSKGSLEKNCDKPVDNLPSELCNERRAARDRHWTSTQRRKHPASPG
jgi:hypothetical protein